MPVNIFTHCLMLLYVVS